LSEVRKGNKNAEGHAPWNKGKPWSEEARAKLSEAQQGKHNQTAPEIRVKMSAATKGIQKSPEWRQHLSEARKAYFARKKAA
jgi:hypothetical protein